MLGCDINLNIVNTSAQAVTFEGISTEGGSETTIQGGKFTIDSLSQNLNSYNGAIGKSDTEIVIAMSAFGGGLTSGACIIKWSK